MLSSRSTVHGLSHVHIEARGGNRPRCVVAGVSTQRDESALIQSTDRAKRSCNLNSGHSWQTYVDDRDRG